MAPLPVLNVSWLQGFSQIDFFKQSDIDKVKDSDEHWRETPS